MKPIYQILEEMTKDVSLSGKLIHTEDINFDPLRMIGRVKRRIEDDLLEVEYLDGKMGKFIVKNPRPVSNSDLEKFVEDLKLDAQTRPDLNISVLLSKLNRWIRRQNRAS